MPFNRDLIESGCVLKTFDGDLTVLERAIDFTVNKSCQKYETAVAATESSTASPASSLDNSPRERRHIKDVVYGDKLDEMPSTLAQEQFVSKQAEVPSVNHHVSKHTVEVPAASGFCFRRNIAETQTITNTVPAVSHPAPKQVVAETRTITSTVQPANKSRELCHATCVSRSVKDVVYGDIDLDGHSGQSTQIKTESKPEEPTIPATHFKSCMREEFSVPHTRIAVKALVSEVSHHTHWRSAIHGF